MAAKKQRRQASEKARQGAASPAAQLPLLLLLSLSSIYHTAPRHSNHQ